MYSVSDNGNTETYMMPGTDLNPRLPSPVFENFEMMASDGSTEFVVDPSLYYPAASPYGYYCTGFESPGEWDERHTVFGLDGADVQYAGGQGENLPYVYYTPSYGFGDSPFNPYNPYIPGAMLGVDGSFVGTHPYYAVSPYASSSSGYVPVLVQPGSDTAASHTTDSRSDTAPSSVHRANGSAVKRTHSSSPATYSMNPSKAASSQTHAFTGTSQGSKINSGTSKRPMSSRNNGSNGSVHGASSHVPQGGNAPGTLHSTRNISYGKLLPETNQVKYSYPVGGGFSDYGSSTNSQAVFNDTFSKFYYRRPSDGNGNFDQLGEQNRGPRTNKSKNQFVVKAYTTRAGNRNAEGNIVISADQYNKEDFPVDYVHAKFFVIKSYSEDDVHKSIKYNVWSSTPNGNKKLSVAYEDAQKIATGKPRGCPIFLFFSVNASGQFCGVAEMVGPVDFDRDMDFWQQDKWSGSFPVKWHIIKDVPNPTFRHIILENNEHKPVTNSRDTQEIMHKQGLEMLKLFRNYSSKTSLLDDFMYYENRQKIMHEERTRLFRRANGHVHSIEGSLKLNHTNDHSQKADEAGTWVEKAAQPNPVGLKIASRSSEVSSSSGVHVSDVASKVLKSSEMQVGDVSSLKIGSLSINPRPIGLQSAAPASSSSSSAAMPKTVAMPKAANGQANGTANVVTVGSLPIKVDAANRSPEMLTIGTIALDPKALQHGKVGGFVKGGVQK